MSQLKNKTLAIFAGYSKNNIIEDYVIFYIKKLSKIADVILVFDNNLPDHEIGKVENYIIHQTCSSHGGYDFGSYKIGFNWVKKNNLLEKYQALIFCNDSVFGPFFSLENIMSKMQAKNIDFWGMFEHCHNKEKAQRYNVENFNHIQSYFIVFNKQIIFDKRFHQFIENIKYGKKRDEIVSEYEIGLSSFLINAGYECGALFSGYSDINEDLIKALSFIKKGFPFLKKKVLLQSESHLYEYLIRKKIIKKTLKKYDSDLIEHSIKINSLWCEREVMNKKEKDFKSEKNCIKKHLKKLISPRKRHLLKKKIWELVPNLNLIFLTQILYNKIIKRKTVVIIKHPSPRTNYMHFGDHHLAKDLAKNLNHDNFFVIDHCLERWNNWETRFAHFVLVLRGGDYYKPLTHNKNILWIISHPDSIKKDELLEYDHICAASDIYTLYLREQFSLSATTLYQFSDPSKFYPEQDEHYENDILFVGNTRGIYREVVRFCIEENLCIAVYGNGWEKYIDKKYIIGKSIDNAELHKYYANAKIVLNDHWIDMRENGFISNRIFDVTLSNGFLISDYLPSIQDYYIDSVVLYKDKDSFINQVQFYLAHTQERDKKRYLAREVTLKNFTVNKTVESLKSILNNFH